MAVQKHNAYYSDEKGKIYYYDKNGNCKDVPPEGFAELERDIIYLSGAISGLPGQVQSDWAEDDASDPSYIKNKPEGLSLSAGDGIGIVEDGGNITVSVTGDYADRENVEGEIEYLSGAIDNIPQKQSDWEETDTSDPAYILNKPDLSEKLDVSAFDDALEEINDTFEDVGEDINFLSGAIDDIPAQVQADWEEDDETDPAFIKNKPDKLSISAGTGIGIDETADNITISVTGNYENWKSWSEDNGSSGVSGSVYIGKNNSANGNDDYVIGKNNSVIGNRNYVIGRDNTTSATNNQKDDYDSYILGTENNASGGYIVGFNNDVRDGYVFGFNNNSTNGGHIFGRNTSANGGSYAIGDSNSTYAGSVAIGKENSADSGAYAIGSNSVAKGASFAIGDKVWSDEGDMHIGEDILTSADHTYIFGKAISGKFGEGSTVIGNGVSGINGYDNNVIIAGNSQVSAQGGSIVISETNYLENNGGPTSEGCISADGSIVIGKYVNYADTKNLNVSGINAKYASVIIGNGMNMSADSNCYIFGNEAIAKYGSTIIGHNGYAENNGMVINPTCMLNGPQKYTFSFNSCITPQNKYYLLEESNVIDYDGNEITIENITEKSLTGETANYNNITSYFYHMYHIRGSYAVAAFCFPLNTMINYAYVRGIWTDNKTFNESTGNQYAYRVYAANYPNVIVFENDNGIKSIKTLTDLANASGYVYFASLSYYNAQWNDYMPRWATDGTYLYEIIDKWRDNAYTDIPTALRNGTSWKVLDNTKQTITVTNKIYVDTEGIQQNYTTYMTVHSAISAQSCVVYPSAVLSPSAIIHNSLAKYGAISIGPKVYSEDSIAINVPSNYDNGYDEYGDQTYPTSKRLFDNSGNLIENDYTTSAQYGSFSVKFGGPGTNYSNGGAMALGTNISAYYGSIGIGYNNTYAYAGSLVFGKSTTAYNGSLGLGFDGVNAENGSITLGCRGASAQNGSMVFGSESILARNGSYAFGARSISANNGSLTIGFNGATATEGAIAIGFNGPSAKDASIAIGLQSITALSESIAIGSRTVYASGAPSFAIGSQGVYASAGGFAIGVNGVNAYNNQGFAIGYNTVCATNGGDFAIGTNSVFARNKGFALGYGGITGEQDSIAIGSKTISATYNAISIGSESNMARAKSVAIGFSNTAINNALLIGYYNSQSEFDGSNPSNSNLFNAFGRSNSVYDNTPDKNEMYSITMLGNYNRMTLDNSASNAYGIMIGERNYLEGDFIGGYNIMLGDNNRSRNESISIGTQNDTNGHSIAFGWKNVAADEYYNHALMLGYCNSAVNNIGQLSAKSTDTYTFITYPQSELDNAYSQYISTKNAAVDNYAIVCDLYTYLAVSPWGKYIDVVIPKYYYDDTQNALLPYNAYYNPDTYYIFSYDDYDTYVRIQNDIRNGTIPASEAQRYIFIRYTDTFDELKQLVNNCDPLQVMPYYTAYSAASATYYNMYGTNNTYQVSTITANIETNSLIIGTNNKAEHYNSYLFGSYNQSLSAANSAKDDGFTFALGLNNKVARNYDMAIGYGVLASGGENIAIGAPVTNSNGYKKYDTKALGYKNTVIRSDITGISNISIDTCISGSITAAPFSFGGWSEICHNSNRYYGSNISYDPYERDYFYICQNNVTNSNISANVHSYFTYNNINDVQSGTFHGSFNHNTFEHNRELMLSTNYTSDGIEENYIGHSLLSADFDEAGLNIINGTSGNILARQCHDNLIYNSNIDININREEYRGFSNNFLQKSTVSATARGLSDSFFFHTTAVFNTPNRWSMNNSDVMFFSRYETDESTNSCAGVVYSNITAGEGFNFLFGTSAKNLHASVSFSDPYGPDALIYNCARIFNFGDNTLEYNANVCNIGEYSYVSGIKCANILGHTNVAVGPGDLDTSDYLSIVGNSNFVDCSATRITNVQYNSIFGNHNNMNINTGYERSFTNNIILGSTNSYQYIPTLSGYKNVYEMQKAWDNDFYTIGSIYKGYIPGGEHSMAGLPTKSCDRNTIIGSHSVITNNTNDTTIIGAHNIVYNTILANDPDDELCYSNNYALGSYNLLSNGSNQVAIGTNNLVSGYNATAFGEGLIANASQVVVGRMNEELPGTNGLSATGVDSTSGALFIVGNGRHVYDSYADADVERSNAMIVSADGTVSATKFAMPNIPDLAATITSIQSDIGDIETALNAIINGSN